MLLLVEADLSSESSTPCSIMDFSKIPHANAETSRPLPPSLFLT
jgi:hypothetical protein